MPAHILTIDFDCYGEEYLRVLRADDNEWGVHGLSQKLRFLYLYFANIVCYVLDGRDHVLSSVEANQKLKFRRSLVITESFLVKLKWTGIF